MAEKGVGVRTSKLNELTKWSNLGRLASGNLPKLTIVAPFVAFIILHNDPLEPLLELSDRRHPNAVINYLSAARFDIFYLGLIVVGLGVGLFTVFCPKQVSAYRSYEEFIELKERTRTENGVAGSLRLTLEKFMADARSEEPDLDEDGVSRRFPRRINEALNALIIGMLSSTDIRGTKDFLDESGEARVGAILQVMHRRSTEDRVLWRPLYTGLLPLSIDVFRLEYLVADYSLPSLRVTIFWTIGFGIMTMLVPTFITTFLVLLDLWNAAGA